MHLKSKLHNWHQVSLAPLYCFSRTMKSSIFLALNYANHPKINKLFDQVKTYNDAEIFMKSYIFAWEYSNEIIKWYLPCLTVFVSRVIY